MENEHELNADQTTMMPMNTSSTSSVPNASFVPIVRLPLSPRVPLVKLDTVIAARGEYPYAINAHVESGTLRWVFNLAVKPGGSPRDLRFWGREVSVFAAGQFAEHAALRSAGVDEVIGEILGVREKFRSGEVCLLLGICRPALKPLRKELGRSYGYVFQRDALEQFLKRRLLS